jgi:hypothetical protein
MQLKNNWCNTKQFQMSFAHSQNPKLITMMATSSLPSKAFNSLPKKCSSNKNRKKKRSNRLCNKRKAHKTMRKQTGKTRPKEKRQKNGQKEWKCKCVEKMNSNSKIKWNTLPKNYFAKSLDSTKGSRASRPPNGTSSKICHNNTIASSSSNTTPKPNEQQSKIT